ncbi:hypothetical protein IAU60_001839 [Kwoniella sp. DSM 27419]
MSFYLAIVSPLDSPLFELSFPSAKPPPPTSATSSTSSFPSWSTFTASNGSDTGAEGSGPKAGGSLGMLGGENKAAPERDRAMCQMIAHKSLDSLEEVMEGTGTLYFKNVDRHNEWIVSAFVATTVKFVLLHDVKNDDGIRSFFMDVWEAYVKILMNPFHTVNTQIRNPGFEGKIRASAKRNL